MRLNGTRTLFLILIIFGMSVVFIFATRKTPQEHTALETAIPPMPSQVVGKLNAVSNDRVSKKNIPLLSQAQVTEIAPVSSTTPTRIELEEAIQKNPRSWSNYENLGDLLLQQGLPYEAIKVAKDCLHVDSHAPYCNDILIKAYEAIADDTQLAAAIAECRTQRPGDFFCVQKARDYLLSRGDVKGAEELILETYDKTADGQEALSRFYLFTKELEKSWLALNQACKLGNQSSCKRSAKGYDDYILRNKF